MPTMNCMHLRNDLYVQFKAKHVLNCPAVMNEEYKLREPLQPFKVGQSRLWNVNFCKDHHNKIEVPDPLAVEDLISSKLNNKQKLARLITQYRDIFFPIFRKARPSFFRVLQRMTKGFNVTSLKYGKYDTTNEKINNNKRLALSISRLLLFIFSFVISYFPYFKLVTLKTLVILCNTLRKEGRAFRNIGKNISLYCVIRQSC